MNDQGEPIVVEIDETKYFHRKYHLGQWREGHWVFGGMERETGRCFLVEVADQTVATLSREIERHILPGSHIVSDGWASYAQIDRIHVAYTHTRSLSIRTIMWTQTSRTHIHRMWRTCGCGRKGSCDASLGQAGSCSLLTCTNLSGVMP